MHAAAAHHDHRRRGRRVAAGEGDDLLGRHAGGLGGARGRVVPHVRGQGVEADRVALDARAVPQPLGDDHVHHAEGQRGVAARAHDQRLVGLGGGLRLPDVDGDHVGAAPARRRHVAGGVGLRGEVGAPQEDELRVRAHVLLGVRLQVTGEAEAEPAEAPADHRAAPRLGAPEVGEAADEVAGDPRAVVGRRQAMAGPEPDRLAARGAHPRGDEVERLVPRRLSPRVGPAARAHQRVQQAVGVADDLARGLAALAEEALAVGVVGVAPQAHEAAVLHLDQHAAEGRVAVHRAHRADDAQAGRGGHGHGAIIPAEAAARRARPLSRPGVAGRRSPWRAPLDSLGDGPPATADW